MATGWVAGGLTLVYMVGEKAKSVGPSFVWPGENAGSAWLQIQANGTCRMFLPRMEMGQNANTGLALIVAEELNIDVLDIEAKYPNTSEMHTLGFTAGSASTLLFSRPTARAAANLREALRSRAADITKLQLDSILDAKGGFTTVSDQFLAYSDLLSDEPLILEGNELLDVPLYTFDPQREHKQVGRATPPLGIQDLVTGAPLFTADMSIPDVLFGRAIKPPVRNAHINSVDFSRAKSIPGMVKLVHENDFVGVVCETPGSLDLAVRAVTVDWKLQQPINQEAIDKMLDVDEALSEGDLEHTLEDQSHRSSAPWDIDLRYEIQLQTHAMQEPRSAIARFSSIDGKESLEIWTGTQDAWAIKRHSAIDIGLSEDQVIVHPMRMGGGFGGREHYDVEKDAVRLARAAGRPVKAQWTREDEFATSRSRPSSAHRIRLAADEQGQLTDWWHAYISGHVFLSRDRLPGWLLPIARLKDADFGVTKGANAPYSSHSRRVEYKDVDLPIDLGVWRSLNGAPNNFVIESSMDELARQRSIDPVDFRLANLGADHERLANCLSRAREMASKEDLPSAPGYGRGFACGIYDHKSYVAVSADIFIDHRTKKIKVERICCVQDVGMAINPDQLRAQIESNLVWSIGMALIERLDIGEGLVGSDNFHNYPIPRMSDMPRLEIEIISQPNIPPAGAGEVALIAGTPAIANAVRDATGDRILRLPIAFDNAWLS